MKTQYKDSQYTLTMKQIEKLRNSTKSLRDRLLLDSLYFPALRRTEVLNLKIEDIDFNRGRLIIHGKFNKTAPVPVGSVYPAYMTDLRHFIGNRKTGYVFESTHKKNNTLSKPFNLSRLNQILAEIGRNSNLNNPNPKKKNINTHLLRHSQARHLKDLGFTAEFIKNYMRHDSIKTTFDTYGTLSLDEMERMGYDKMKFEKLIE